MKKIFAFIFVMMIIVALIQTVSANEAIDLEGIVSIDICLSSPYIGKYDISRDGYTIKNPGEIKMLSHYLNTLTENEHGGGLPTDSVVVRFEIKYSDESVIRCDMYYSVACIFYEESGEIYNVSRHALSDYYRVCDFVNSLILNKPYKDTVISTETSDWAKSYVDKATMDGLVPKWNQIGYINYIPRVEVCQLIDTLFTARGINKEVADDYTYLKEYPFDDTKDISVKELYVKDIISGKSETEFFPYDYITREEFARILAETYKFVSKSNSSVSSVLQYNDKEQILEWATESVGMVTYLGLMQGDENGNFNPKDNITKEQVIVTLLRLDELIAGNR